jgi:hypothetical protein
VSGRGRPWLEPLRSPAARELCARLQAELAEDLAQVVPPVLGAPMTRSTRAVLATAEVFSEDVASQVMRSVRLDLGYGSWVHP